MKSSPRAHTTSKFRPYAPAVRRPPDGVSRHRHAEAGVGTTLGYTFDELCEAAQYRALSDFHRSEYASDHADTIFEQYLWQTVEHYGFDIEKSIDVVEYQKGRDGLLIEAYSNHRLLVPILRNERLVDDDLFERYDRMTWFYDVSEFELVRTHFDGRKTRLAFEFVRLGDLAPDRYEHLSARELLAYEDLSRPRGPARRSEFCEVMYAVYDVLSRRLGTILGESYRHYHSDSYKSEMFMTLLEDPHTNLIFHANGKPFFGATCALCDAGIICRAHHAID